MPGAKRATLSTGRTPRKRGWLLYCSLCANHAAFALTSPSELTRSYTSAAASAIRMAYSMSVANAWSAIAFSRSMRSAFSGPRRSRLRVASDRHVWHRQPCPYAVTAVFPVRGQKTVEETFRACTLAPSLRRRASERAELNARHASHRQPRLYPVAHDSPVSGQRGVMRTPGTSSRPEHGPAPEKRAGTGVRSSCRSVLRAA